MLFLHMDGRTCSKSRRMVLQPIAEEVRGLRSTPPLDTPPLWGGRIREDYGLVNKKVCGVLVKFYLVVLVEYYPVRRNNEPGSGEGIC